jgi:hypothetical protein
MPFLTGKNKIGRFVITRARNGRPAVLRYYPQRLLAEFNAAVLAELGEPPGTPMKEAFTRWSATATGWKRDRKR